MVTLYNLIGGLQMGSIYALIALGYTMVYGIVKLINFAHGDIMMVGAYAIYWMMSTTMMKSIAATHPIVAGVVSVLFAVVVCVVLGVLIDRIAYKPLRNAPRISALITAIGISLALEITAQLVFGSGQMNFPTIVPKIKIFKVGRRSVNLLEVLTFAVSMLLMIGLTLFVQTTRTGKAMRAVSEDQGAAMLMGVNVDKTISITFGIGCALAAIGSGILRAEAVLRYAAAGHAARPEGVRCRGARRYRLDSRRGARRIHYRHRRNVHQILRQRVCGRDGVRHSYSGPSLHARAASWARR